MGPSDVVYVEKRRVQEPIPEDPQWPVDVLWIPPLPGPPERTYRWDRTWIFIHFQCVCVCVSQILIEYSFTPGVCVCVSHRSLQNISFTPSGVLCVTDPYRIFIHSQCLLCVCVCLSQILTEYSFTPVCVCVCVVCVSHRSLQNIHSLPVCVCVVRRNREYLGVCGTDSSRHGSLIIMAPWDPQSTKHCKRHKSSPGPVLSPPHTHTTHTLTWWFLLCKE